MSGEQAQATNPIGAVSHRAMGWYRQGFRVASFLDVIIVGIIAYLLWPLGRSRTRSRRLRSR